MPSAAKQPSTTPSRRLDTGIENADRRKIAEQMAKVLASTYTLLLKTHVCHWNITGPLFLPLHELTERHYHDLFEATDVLAERIRALGHRTPLSFGQLLPKSDIEEGSTPLSTTAMVENLVQNHEQMARQIREAARAADDADDLVTADLYTQRLNFHEKAIWMLRSIIAL